MHRYGPLSQCNPWLGGILGFECEGVILGEDLQDRWKTRCAQSRQRGRSDMRYLSSVQPLLFDFVPTAILPLEPQLSSNPTYFLATKLNPLLPLSRQNHLSRRNSLPWLLCVLTAKPGKHSKTECQQLVLMCALTIAFSRAG